MLATMPPAATRSPQRHVITPNAEYVSEPTARPCRKSQMPTMPMHTRITNAMIRRMRRCFFARSCSVWKSWSLMSVSNAVVDFATSRFALSSACSYLRRSSSRSSRRVLTSYSSADDSLLSARTFSSTSTESEKRICCSEARVSSSNAVFCSIDASIPSRRA